MTVADMSGSGLPPTAEELARAWDALRSGQFRGPQVAVSRPARARHTATPLLFDLGTAGTRRIADTPVPGPVVLVVGAHGWSGASTTALLLAEAAARGGSSARLVDAADPATSGLVGAAVTEHGHDESGEWRRGSRTVQDATGQARYVWLERLGWPTLSAYAVPAAAATGGAAGAAAGVPGLTVVDAGRPLTDLLRLTEDPTGQHHWLAQLLRAAPVVVTARATVAGIQRAGAAAAAIAAVRDPGGALDTPACAEQAAGLQQHSSAQVLEQMLLERVEGTGSRAEEAAGQPAPLVVTLVGSSRLPRLLEDVLGATLPTITAADRGSRGMEGRERLVLLPAHGDLTVQGVTSSELPRQLVPAATRLLQATGCRVDPLSADPEASAGASRPPRRWRTQR